jgi:hypothetical protein
MQLVIALQTRVKYQTCKRNQTTAKVFHISAAEMLVRQDFDPTHPFVSACLRELDIQDSLENHLG